MIRESAATLFVLQPMNLDFTRTFFYHLVKAYLLISRITRKFGGRFWHITDIDSHSQHTSVGLIGECPQTPSLRRDIGPVLFEFGKSNDESEIPILQ